MNPTLFPRFTIRHLPSRLAFADLCLACHSCHTSCDACGSSAPWFPMLPFALSLIALVMACLIPGGTILMIAIGIGWLLWGMLAKKPLRIAIGSVIAVAGVVLVPLIQDQFVSAPMAVTNGSVSPAPVSVMAAPPSTPLLPATPMPYAATSSTAQGTTTQHPLATPPPIVSAGANGGSHAEPSGSLDLSGSGLGGAPAPAPRPSSATPVTR